jgi:hypothetical protein
MNQHSDAYLPAGAPRYPFHLPDRVVDSAPKCITRVEFITQNHRLPEAEALNRLADLHYLVGNFPAIPESKQVKGKDGRAAQMLTDMQRWEVLMERELKHFARQWLTRARSNDLAEPGFDGRSLSFEQAWCKYLMKKRLTIRDGSWANRPEPRRYRIRVCPEPQVSTQLAHGDNLPSFMRELMRRIEGDLGAGFPERSRPLIWIGAGHYLPEHSPAWLSPEERVRWSEQSPCHAHFAVRGVDTAGRVLWFERPYVYSEDLTKRLSGLENRARGLLQEFFDGTGYSKAG